MRRFDRTSWKLVILAGLIAGCRPPPPKGPPVFFPAPPEKPRLQVLKVFGNEKDLGRESKFVALVLGKKENYLDLPKPYSAVFNQGKLYVSDTRDNKVYVVDFVKKRFFELPGANGMGALKKPIGLSFDVEGNLFVTDTLRRQILVYGADGRFQRAIGDGSYKPAGVAVRGGEIFVTAVDDHRIMVLDRKSGKVLRSFGKPGLEDGQFSYPTNIALDQAGNIYVSDAMGARVQMFDRDGKFLKRFGHGVGVTIGQLVRPKGVSLDEHQRLYVADAANNYVQIFDEKGRLLMFFGPYFMPAGVSVSYDKEALALFAGEVDPKHKLEYLVVAVSQMGPKKITILGFLK